MSKTKLQLDNPDYIEQYATITPTAWKVPQADGSGKLDDGWISDGVKDKTQFIKSFTAGQDLVAGNAVIMGNGVSYVAGTADYVSGVSSDSDITDTVWYANAITTSDNARYIKAVKIKDSVKVLRTLTFSTPVPVSPNTNYSVVFRTTGGLHTTLVASIRTGQGTSIGTSDIGGLTATSTIQGNQWVSGGIWNLEGVVNGVGSKSTNSGGSWSSINNNAGGIGGTGIEFEVQELNTEAGLLYKADASLANEFANNFIGFANESVSSTESCEVIIGGISDNHTGLTTGATYYLSNTPGAIGTSPGSRSRKIGIAVSDTELLIKHDNH